MKKLLWDSVFFNKKVYEINLDIESFIFKDSEPDVLYVKSTENIDLDIPFYTKTFEENKIEFCKKLTIVNDKKNEVVSIFSISDYLKYKQDLYKLAYISGENSRFLLDEGFGRKSFEKLYQKWIDNSLNKSIANEFFVYVENGQILGFITVSINNDSAKIGLFAVCSNTQGKGIGTQLLMKVENYLIENHVQNLKIPTQLNNTKACNFYTKSGYKIESNIYIKHYWRNDTI